MELLSLLIMAKLALVLLVVATARVWVWVPVAPRTASLVTAKAA